LAKTYVQKAYDCDLTLVWNTLGELLEQGKAAPDKPASDKGNLDKLQAHKTHLDFLVANLCFFSTLTFVWALVFSFYGHPFLAISFLLIGSGICRHVWYTAAVEQYRLLQHFTISLLSGPVRFRLLQELRAPLPADADGERSIWRAYNEAFKINPAVGDAARRNFRYKHPSP
jgi:hypothetical protein